MIPTIGSAQRRRPTAAEILALTAAAIAGSLLLALAGHGGRYRWKSGAVHTSYARWRG